MLKPLLLSLLFYSCGSFSSKDETNAIKKESINLLKDLTITYSKDEQGTAKFFADTIQCLVCSGINVYEDEYKLSKVDFIKNHLHSVLPLISYEKIKKEKTLFTKDENNYILSYNSTKTNLEGASVLITFGYRNKILKISRIETIP